MFQFRWSPQPQLYSDRSQKLYCGVTKYDLGGVSPFGHRRVIDCWHLTGDYRGQLRPSSATYAKASTVCVSKTFNYCDNPIRNKFLTGRPKSLEVHIFLTRKCINQLRTLHLSMCSSSLRLLGVNYSKLSSLP